MKPRQLLEDVKKKGTTTSVVWAGMHDVVDGVFLPRKTACAYLAGYMWCL
jgi:hypothetical protein